MPGRTTLEGSIGVRVTLDPNVLFSMLSTALQGQDELDPWCSVLRWHIPEDADLGWVEEGFRLMTPEEGRAHVKKILQGMVQGSDDRDDGWDHIGALGPLVGGDIDLRLTKASPGRRIGDEVRIDASRIFSGARLCENRYGLTGHDDNWWDGQSGNHQDKCDAFLQLCALGNVCFPHPQYRDLEADHRHHGLSEEEIAVLARRARVARALPPGC